jgi:hypothetical protein
MLDHQRARGIWDDARPHFHTMDAIYVLVRLPDRIGHRTDECRDALRRALDGVREGLAADPTAYLTNPHRMLAFVHAVGLLAETLGDELICDPPFRFDWDAPAMYRCDAIRRLESE